MINRNNRPARLTALCCVHFYKRCLIFALTSMFKRLYSLVGYNWRNFALAICFVPVFVFKKPVVVVNIFIVTVAEFCNTCVYNICWSSLNSCCSLSTLSTSWFTVFSMLAECDCSRIDLFTSVLAFVLVFFESLVSTRLRRSPDV